jgi:hypothetical protein
MNTLNLHFSKFKGINCKSDEKSGVMSEVFHFFFFKASVLI